ncbi:MAG: ABC transporter permease [Deltaproteobacteria bacterium]|nr:ABC transporter permease [Deltaproteobacteria bacterium]MCB9786271.1 ABC transporter permease [Deltaproteobacteria bacterium]
MRAGLTRLGSEGRCLATVLWRTGRASPHIRGSDLRDQLGRLALSALPLISVAALFAGMVIALQTSLQLARLGSGHLVADVVSVSLVRELAPIFTALLMAGKAGAGLASELGMVVLSGQAQAMRALSLDIDRELVAPRVLACVAGTFLLTVAAILTGLLGGMVLGSARLGLSPVHYLNRAVHALAPADFACGLLKALAFGVLIAAIGCRQGLRDKSDPAELGRHTMTAVVASSFLILVSDHVLTTLIVACIG